MSLELAPGENKILKALQQEELRSFTELLGETGLSGPSLSEYLKSLQKKGFIKRDIDSRKYFITSNGREALEKLRIIEILIEKEESSEVQIKPFREGEWLKEIVPVFKKGEKITLKTIDEEAISPVFTEALGMHQIISYRGEQWTLAKVLQLNQEKKPLILIGGDYLIFKRNPNNSIDIKKIKIERRE